jgi:integrase/recombinase XerD
MRMEAAVGAYLRYLQVERQSAENTIVAYQTDLKQLVTVLQRLGLGQEGEGHMTPEGIRGYVQWLLQQGYRPATVSRKMAAVRSFLEFHEPHDAQLRGAMLQALQSPPSPKRRPRVLSEEEITRLLNAPLAEQGARAIRDASILALLYYTGLRAAEAVGLKVEDIDLPQGTARIAGRIEKSLPLGAAAAPLQRYLQTGRPALSRSPAEHALFLNQRGQALSRQGLWLVVKHWARQVGVGSEVSPHSLRNSLAQHMLSRGRTRREVQHLLGLSSPNAIRVRRTRR